MDNGIFGVCPHCGTRTIDKRMVLSVSKEYYICTNHKVSKIVPIDKLRARSTSVSVQPVKIDFPEKPVRPREHSISWEITRKARWDRYCRRLRLIHGKPTNQPMNLTQAELLMSDKSGTAKLATRLDRG
jgi:hypothetical protein